MAGQPPGDDVSVPYLQQEGIVWVTFHTHLVLKGTPHMLSSQQVCTLEPFSPLAQT